jgi:glycyl-radical enzyme activating protein family
MIKDNDQYGCVFNIQQYSVHDGPGIRTIVFLKGCPLHCAWCSNPESQNIDPELAWSANRCIGCHLCLVSCTQTAIKWGENDKIKIDRNLCNRCFHCADVCPPSALNILGVRMSVEDVLRKVESDSSFYRRSEGGMTLSGGEPLQQAGFSINLLREAKRYGINTAIETSGNVQWPILEQACRLLNTVMYDLKCLNSAKHSIYTGIGNELILNNLKMMCSTFPDLKVLVRTPVIPGFNDAEEEILAIANFVKPFPNVKYELLRYHRLGEPKYLSLDRNYPLGDVKLDVKIFNQIKLAAKELLGQRLID